MGGSNRAVSDNAKQMHHRYPLQGGHRLRSARSIRRPEYLLSGVLSLQYHRSETGFTNHLPKVLSLFVVHLIDQLTLVKTLMAMV